jgi:hypothetical protein
VWREQAFGQADLPMTDEERRKLRVIAGGKKRVAA